MRSPGPGSRQVRRARGAPPAALGRQALPPCRPSAQRPRASGLLKRQASPQPPAFPTPPFRPPSSAPRRRQLPPGGVSHSRGPLSAPGRRNARPGPQPRHAPGPAQYRPHEAPPRTSFVSPRVPPAEAPPLAALRPAPRDTPTPTPTRAFSLALSSSFISRLALLQTLLSDPFSGLTGAGCGAENVKCRAH